MSLKRSFPLVKRGRRAFTITVVLFIVVFAWLEIAPLALGGRASYVVTDGVSMLPRIKTDGLVITRSEPSYHIGEVVAYHNADLHSVVLHRIVAIEGAHFVFKGDNNDFKDGYHPVKSEIVGKEWIYLPRAGRIFQGLRSPIAFGVLMACVGAIAFTASPSRRKRNQHHHIQ